MTFSKWNDPSYVRLPFKDPARCKNDRNWIVIIAALTDLKAKCQMVQTHGINAASRQHGIPKFWLRDAIHEYNEEAKDDCNFHVVQDKDEIVSSLMNVLPIIVDNALSLPHRIKSPIMVLKKGENMTVTLDRNLVCSIIANGFLSTFPDQSDANSLNNFNFWRLFHHGSKDRSNAKREKIKCLLEYFEQMGPSGTNLPNTFISYQRRAVPNMENWDTSTEVLSDLRVTSTGKIEDATGMLQVDFANKAIGGGVLKAGAVQEEIRFIICPELIAARLFTETLRDDETVTITGSRQFSGYTGYSSGFIFKNLEAKDNQLNRSVDNYGREHPQVVGMDAKYFPENKSHFQYKKQAIDRELHKSFVAFIPGHNKTTIATGNWGCGAFGGDPELKFLIQWMSASKNQRSVLYHARNEAQKIDLENMVQFLVSKKVSTGTLYKVLRRYEEEALMKPWSLWRLDDKRTLFEYIRENVT